MIVFDTQPALDEPSLAPLVLPLAEVLNHDARLAIVGSGPAGLTAAIYAARAGLAPLVIAGTVPGGQLTLTSEVENYPGFAEGINGPELMGLMRRQATRFGATFLDNADVDSVELAYRPFTLTTRVGQVRAEVVIIATGASAIWLDLPNEQRLRGRGVSACATCDAFFFRGKHVAVVGGGDSAAEEALYLTRFASAVTLLVRRDRLRASRIMADRVLAHPDIDVRFDMAVEDVEGEDVLRALALRGPAGPERLAVDGLFVAIGHRPNTAFLGGALETDGHGYLRVVGETGTAIEGVFVAGDVHDDCYRQAVTAAGAGAKAALDVERYLAAGR